MTPPPRVPDARWLWENEPCRAACPVHTDAGGYVTAIAEGRYRDAYLIARAPNPFASICGRVCAAPCEPACRRGTVDAPIAIRALKRFVTERFGVESFAATAVWHEAHGPVPPAAGPSVGVIGGGPAGLSAAHDLRLAGHPVTVYEAQDRLGGMMVLGIPEYRLARALITREVEAILELGVEARTGFRVGIDASLADLLDEHDAVFLAVGTGRGRDLDLPGHDARRRPARHRVPAERQPGLPRRPRGTPGRGRRRPRGLRRRPHRAARGRPRHRRAARRRTAAVSRGRAARNDDDARRGARRRAHRRPGRHRHRARVCRGDSSRSGGDRRGRARGHHDRPPARPEALRRRHTRHRARDHRGRVGLRRRGPLRADVPTRHRGDPARRLDHPRGGPVCRPRPARRRRGRPNPAGHRARRSGDSGDIASEDLGRWRRGARPAQPDRRHRRWPARRRSHSRRCRGLGRTAVRPQHRAAPPPGLSPTRHRLRRRPQGRRPDYPDRPARWLRRGGDRLRRGPGDAGGDCAASGVSTT